MIIRMLAIMGAIAALVFASPVRAEWYEASSDHFVIYADDSEKDIRRFSENLERYHSAMEFLTGRKIEKPSPSNRVVIFVVGNGKDIRRLAGNEKSSIAGFYIPRAGASRAFVQDIRNKTRGYSDFSTVVLLHEYAHHFTMSSSRFAMPRWLSEGSAEFFASASFKSDGTVLIGRPALHRAGELFHAADVSVEELLDHELYERNRPKGGDAFYGRSWLLYHYLTFSEERRGQLGTYQRAVIAGTPSIEAGRQAFGDFDDLEDDLSAYLRKSRALTFELKPEMLKIGEITLRKLSEGEAEMMQVRIRSQRGVNEEQAAELLVEARAIAAKYPNDPGVLAALAEAEFDAGYDDEAIAAADRAITLDPGRTNAYVQKGFALFRKADAASPDQRADAYKLAMEPFSALNRIENDHPMPLIYYYRSFADRGLEPSETAKHALERAAQLAPFDKTLWFDVAMMQAQEGKPSLAIQSLKPLAADPHGGERAEMMQSVIETLATREEGVPINPAVLLAGGAIAAVAEAAPESNEEGAETDGAEAESADAE